MVFQIQNLYSYRIYIYTLPPYKRTGETEISKYTNTNFFSPAQFFSGIFPNFLLKKHQKIVARPVLPQNWSPVPCFSPVLLYGGGGVILITIFVLNNPICKILEFRFRA